MNMKREASKYFIEQFIVDEDNNPTKWTSDDWNRLTKGNTIIGYLFLVKEGVKFGPATRLLNLYLIRPAFVKNPIDDAVPYAELGAAWDKFMENLFDEKKTKSQSMVFSNPPIAYWLDTKENWCKKQADAIVQKYNWSFDEALSEVYYIVAKCFQKKHVYMGNLGYVTRAIYNSVLMNYRYNRNRLHNGNPNVISGDQPAYEDSGNGDNALCTVWDTIGEDDPWFAEQDYKQFEADLRKIMRQSFSDREIDQIFMQRAGYLPMGLYRRLLKWRKAHPIEELRKLI